MPIIQKKPQTTAQPVETTDDTSEFEQAYNAGYQDGLEFMQAKVEAYYIRGGNTGIEKIVKENNLAPSIAEKYRKELPKAKAQAKQEDLAK